MNKKFKKLEYVMDNITLPFCIAVFMITLYAADYHCAGRKTKLSECLSAGRTWSLLGTQKPDSSWLDKCARYHREDLIDKYCMVVDKKTKKYKKDCWRDNSDILKYIERGP